MLVNTLIHREFTAAHYARFIIEKDRMFTENANRAVTGGTITPDNYVPDPKNPIIAAFFRNIGLADELGSGVRRLHHYVPRYSGKPPELIDGDVFRVIVPLDDAYSFDVEINKAHLKHSGDNNDCALTEKTILKYLSECPHATQNEIAAAIGKTRRGVQEAIVRLRKKDMLKREGAKKNGKWTVTGSF